MSLSICKYSWALILKIGHAIESTLKIIDTVDLLQTKNKSDHLWIVFEKLLR
jgi:hypothetical protein